MSQLFRLVAMSVSLVVALNAAPQPPNRQPPFEMPDVVPPTFPDREFDIRDFGAVADSDAKATDSIRNAIEACAAAGGGTVIIPKGLWLTGAIHLKSNINLHLAEGATLKFSTDPEDYLPVVFVRWAGFECYNYSPLIYARDCENIAITGPGTIDGNGRPWWDWVRKQDAAAAKLYDMVKNEVPVEERVFGNLDFPMRPQLIQPINCRNILLDGFTVKSGPFWTIQIVYGENVLVRNLTVLTEGPNNDGINADSTRNMIVEDCMLSIGDDGIAIKSGLNEDGWRVNRPSENIIVRRLTVQGGHAGVSMGSDMSAGVRNVFVHDCVFNDLWRGLWIKSTRGRGGVVENITYSNIKITHTHYESLGITTAYSAWFGSDTGVAPTIRNITYDNIHIPWTNKAMSFEGLSDAPLENITIRDSSLLGTLPSQFSRVNGLRFENVELAPYWGDYVAELWDCRDLRLDKVTVPAGPKHLFLVHGTGNEGIEIIGGDIPDDINLVQPDEGIEPPQVTRREPAL